MFNIDLERYRSIRTSISCNQARLSNEQRYVRRFIAISKDAHKILNDCKGWFKIALSQLSPTSTQEMLGRHRTTVAHTTLHAK